MCEETLYTTQSPSFCFFYFMIADKHEQRSVDNRNMQESLLIDEYDHRDHP